MGDLNKKITRNLNGTDLQIALESRLDTATAPELEKALQDSPGLHDECFLHGKKDKAGRGLK